MKRRSCIKSSRRGEEEINKRTCHVPNVSMFNISLGTVSDSGYCIVGTIIKECVVTVSPDVLGLYFLVFSLLGIINNSLYQICT